MSKPNPQAVVKNLLRGEIKIPLKLEFKPQKKNIILILPDNLKDWFEEETILEINICNKNIL